MRPRAQAGPPLTARAWAAPRAAYLLTAAMADNSERAGIIAATDAMSDEWNGYSEAGQREILIALGAQTRVSLQLLRDKLGRQIEMDTGGVFMPGSTPSMIAGTCRSSAEGARRAGEPAAVPGR